MATESSDQSCPQCQQPFTQGAAACPNCGLVFSEGLKNTEALNPTSTTTPSSASGETDETLPTVESLQAADPSEADASPAAMPPQPIHSGDQLVADDMLPPPALRAASAPKKDRQMRKFVLIGAAILLLLAATGGGIAYYATRPKPLITASSDYKVGSVPAGSTSTTLHVEGKQFSANSAITFLLDGHPAPGSQIVPSDENGAFEADVTVTAKWKLGSHQLTARDANGYTTKRSAKVMVVHQGEANTPGPNGAPADDTGHFFLYVTVLIQNSTLLPLTNSTSIFDTETRVLIVQGQADPAGGAVCDAQKDNGKTTTTDFTQQITLPDGTIVNVGFFPNNDKSLSLQKLSEAYTCSGTYHGAQISYTETNTIYQEVYSKGVTCSLTAPRVIYQLQGAFTSATTASGTFSVPESTITCSDGHVEKTEAETGTWIGVLFS